MIKRTRTHGSTGDVYRGAMRWVWRGVIGLLVLAVLVPVLVVAGAAVGLSPRYWTGTQLVAVRLTAGLSSTPPHTAEGRTYSSTELDALRDSLTVPDLPKGVYMWGPNYDRRQIIFTTSSLTHGGLAFSHNRYGDRAAVEWTPLSGMPSMEGSPPAPSAWSQTNPIGTWCTLVTGFPAYLAAGVLLTAGGWLLVRRLRRKRPATTPSPAEG